MTARRKTGRPRLEFDLRQVEQLGAIMCTDEEIAGVLGCNVDTIRERKKEPEFSGALEKGRATGKASLRRIQWNTAKGGNATMQIWLGKQWLGQRDRQDVESLVVNVDNLTEDQLAKLAAGEDLRAVLATDDA